MKRSDFGCEYYYSSEWMEERFSGMQKEKEGAYYVRSSSVVIIPEFASYGNESIGSFK